MRCLYVGLVVVLGAFLQLTVQRQAQKDAEEVKSSAADVLKDIVNLTTDNFDDVVYGSTSKLVFVKFYAPWCGHCKELAPEYEQAAANPALKEVTFAKINCDEHSKPCEKLRIEGYPTMFIFKRGEQSPIKYENGRKAADIASYVMNLLRPPFTSVFTKDALDDALAANPRAAVVYVDSPEVKTLLEAAEKTKQEAPIVVVFNKELAAKAKEEAKSSSSMLLEFRDGEKKKSFTGEVTAESFDKFVRSASIPVLAEIGPENYMKYVQTGLPIAFFFYEGSAMKEKFTPILEAVAPKFREHANFVFIDAVKFKGYASALNVTPKAGKQEIEWPVFVIHDVTKEIKFVCDQPSLTQESLTKFMESYASGSLKATFKSQEPPKENNGPVKIVVNETFNHIALDKSKDVLVDLYAPWCGMCKRIEPAYEKLAIMLKDHPNVVLAKMDATLNDLPTNISFKLEHYPTFLLFKAESNEMVECTSFLDIKAIHDFLKANATNNKFDIAAEVDKFMAEEATKKPTDASAKQGDVHEDEAEVEEEEVDEL